MLGRRALTALLNCSMVYFNPTSVFFPNCLWTKSSSASYLFISYLTIYKRGRESGDLVQLPSINPCRLPPRAKPHALCHGDTKRNEAQPCSQPCQGTTVVRNRNPSMLADGKGLHTRFSQANSCTWEPN